MVNICRPQLQNGWHFPTFSPGAWCRPFRNESRVRGDLEVDNRWWTCLNGTTHEALGGSNKVYILFFGTRHFWHMWMLFWLVYCAAKNKGVIRKTDFPKIFKLFYMAILLESRKKFHWWFGSPSFCHWRINKTFHDYIEKPKLTKNHFFQISNISINTQNTIGPPAYFCGWGSV